MARSSAVGDGAAILRRWAKPEDSIGQLVCFPHAGASAAAYMAWPAAMAPELEVMAVQPPGRERRIAEEPYRSMDALVSEVVEAVSQLDAERLVLFGHSLGASVAFETARELERRGTPPRLLLVSGRRAPHRPPEQLIAEWDDQRLLERLRSLGGTPKEVFQHRELVDLILHTFRADMHVLESYRPSSGSPLGVPMQVFGGDSDTLTEPHELELWRQHASADPPVTVFPGGHFYLHDESAEPLRAAVKEAARRALRG